MVWGRSGHKYIWCSDTPNLTHDAGTDWITINYSVMIMTLYSLSLSPSLPLSLLPEKFSSGCSGVVCSVSFLYCFHSAWNSISNLLAIKLNPPLQQSSPLNFYLWKVFPPVNQIGFICRYNFTRVEQSSLGICSKLPVLPRLNLKHSINFMSLTSQSTSI